MAKMRLCSRCGVSLDEIEPGVFSCPRGHGEWSVNQSIKSIPYKHPIPNGKAHEAGAMEFTGGSKSGKKRKKKPTMDKLANIFDRP